MPATLTHQTDQATTPVFSLQELNQLLPAYQFEAFLDSGGMGSVYKARQKSLDRIVAIKLLHPELCQDKAFRTSFEREAKAMAKLNQRNLVPVYDFGEVENRLFIVMKFIDGQSLHDSCAGKALVPEEAAELVTGICRGLQHAHHHRILHRDIKPANILVDTSFQPNIVDFGVAEAVGTDFGNEQESFCTPDYAAPETAFQGCRLDARTDIYSVGVLFYELLTSELPGPEPVAPSALIDCPPGYDDIVMRAIHPDPDQRYQTAEEFTEDLERLQASSTVNEKRQASQSSRPLQTRPGSFTYHCRPPSLSTRSNHSSKATAAFITVALLIGLFGLILISQLG